MLDKMDTPTEIRHVHNMQHTIIINVPTQQPNWDCLTRLENQTAILPVVLTTGTYTIVRTLTTRDSNNFFQLASECHFQVSG